MVEAAVARGYDPLLELRKPNGGASRIISPERRLGGPLQRAERPRRRTSPNREGQIERALDLLDAAAESEQQALFWLYMESAAKGLGQPERASTYRRRMASVRLEEAASRGRFSDPRAGERAMQLMGEGCFEQALDLLDAATEPDQEGSFWTSMEMAAQSYGLGERAVAYRYRRDGRPGLHGSLPTGAGDQVQRVGR